MSDRVYVDPAGFSLVVPQSWQLRRNVRGLAVVASLPDALGTGANIGVIVEQVSQADLTVETYLTLAQRQAPRAVCGFRVIDQAVRDVAGQQQGVLEYISRKHSHELHSLAVVALAAHQAVVATFSATARTYAQLLPSADPVLASLRTRGVEADLSP